MEHDRGNHVPHDRMLGATAARIPVLLVSPARDRLPGRSYLCPPGQAGVIVLCFALSVHGLTPVTRTSDAGLGGVGLGRARERGRPQVAESKN